MTISSINTNLAALLAQQNIGAATSATNTEVAQLSSGNRIVTASTDVAALSVGTSLQSQVNVLNTALTVSSEGSSLLQVADGGLAQIQAILQQQQSITTQAQSGSLSSTQLGFLNEEFQSLTQEINQIAGSTNFNGVNLINGAISGNVALSTNSSSVSSSATTPTSSPFVTFSGATAATGDTITINGVKVTFADAQPGTTSAAGDVSVSGGTNSTDFAAEASNLAAFLNSSGDPQFADLHFIASGATVSAAYTGGALQGTLASLTVSASFGTASDVTTANITVVGPAGQNGLNLDSYSALGTVSGSVLVDGGTAANTVGAPIDVSGLENNAGFIGNFNSIGTITAQYDGTAGDVTLSFTAGGITYTTTQAQVYNSAAAISLTFNGVDPVTNLAEGGKFVLNLNGAAIGSTANLTSQTQADSFAAEINNALSGVSIYQNRTVSSFQQGDIVSNSGGTQIANLSNASVALHLSNYANANISSFTVAAPTQGSSDATFQAVINGDTYSSYSGIGNQIKTGTIITLQDLHNPDNTISLTTGNTAIAGSTGNVALDLSSSSNASLIQSALQQAFGLGNTTSSLTFQVGSSTTDTIGVSIGSATTSALFGGASLDVLTQQDAATAANAVQTALNTVTSLRASVGALEQQFTYASNAISSAAQNEGAAQSTLLDTDVAKTSTQFATSQVQLQAGVAVLAQANQLPQSLLKLLA